ncbi:MAG: hypothetical protein A3G76_15105 [Acidobacteria bacterium RIFCSPLOWO2_12_FULL_65_11]|nr:MAG: hypothetical protein A3H95_02455 [Acidobacteria bacterium RIFCSPLOWO2_02_FULL_64_15]OFW28978.1 MAG: hypothetical protein A3G76_15105 [Acidobacteria bacterium RIFCSPLOWO2_12_FULL_65_11]
MRMPSSVRRRATAYEVTPLRDKVEAAYHRTDLFDRRRALMDAWAKFTTARPSEVVSIRA